MLSKITNFSLVLFIGLVLGVFASVSVNNKAIAQTTAGDAFVGWAWSDNIGWISFSSANDHNATTTGIQPANFAYGVYRDSIGVLSGYAWANPAGEGLQSASAPVVTGPTNPPPVAEDTTTQTCADLPLTVDNVTSTLLNPFTGWYEQTIRVNNPSCSDKDAVKVVIGGLPSGVEVMNSWQKNSSGEPFVIHSWPILAGQSVNMTIEYRKTGLAAITPSFVATADQPVLIDTVNTVGALVNQGISIVRDSLGRYTLEFLGANNYGYMIRYSDNGTTWYPTPVLISDGAHYTKWVDNGPPKTPFAADGGRVRYWQLVTYNCVGRGNLNAFSSQSSLGYGYQFLCPLYKR